MESLKTQVLLDRVTCPFIHTTKMTVSPHLSKVQASHLIQQAKRSPHSVVTLGFLHTDSQ